METIVEWLPRIGATITLVAGMVIFFKPKMILRMGFEVTKPLAWGEVRAVFGGMNIGLATAALSLQSPEVYLTLGMGWLFLVPARIISIVVDGATVKESAPGIIFDVVVAFLLMSAYFA